jgi:hypothetical protein
VAGLCNRFRVIWCGCLWFAVLGGSGSAVRLVILGLPCLQDSRMIAQDPKISGGWRLPSERKYYYPSEPKLLFE